jgi:hypothetical protein
MLPNEIVLAPLPKLKIKYELSYQTTTRLKYIDKFDQLLIIQQWTPTVDNTVRTLIHFTIFIWYYVVKHFPSFIKNHHFSSYQKQALTVMISPLCTNDHDTVILLNVALNTINLTSEMIWKIWKKSRLNSEMIWKIWRKAKLNSEKISKIWKKIVKQPNPLLTKTYTYLPIYLHFYQNYRFYSIFASYFPIYTCNTDNW